MCCPNLGCKSLAFSHTRVFVILLNGHFSGAHSNVKAFLVIQPLASAESGDWRKVARTQSGRSRIPTRRMSQHPQCEDRAGLSLSYHWTDNKHISKLNTNGFTKTPEKKTQHWLLRYQLLIFASLCLLRFFNISLVLHRKFSFLFIAKTTVH